MHSKFYLLLLCLTFFLTNMSTKASINSDFIEIDRRKKQRSFTYPSSLVFLFLSFVRSFVLSVFLCFSVSLSLRRSRLLSSKKNGHILDIVVHLSLYSLLRRNPFCCFSRCHSHTHIDDNSSCRRTKIVDDECDQVHFLSTSLVVEMIVFKEEEKNRIEYPILPSFSLSVAFS